jgi:hypothetical protein
MYFPGHCAFTPCASQKTERIITLFLSFPRRRRKKRRKLSLFLSFCILSVFLFFLPKGKGNIVSQNKRNEKYEDKEIQEKVEEKQKSEKK